MKIPTWKKLASHIVPFTLEETGSEQNPDLQVLLVRGRIQLVSGDAIYSWDDLYRNFDFAFRELEMEKREIEDVLVLGLGLGSVPFLLEKNYGRKYRYTAVEWDEEIAELATKYTFPRLQSPIDVVTADAEIFIEICEDTFDLLVMDIFEDDLTPPQFETPEFLQTCSALLRPGGLLLFNRLHNSLPDKTATERFFKKTFQPTLPGSRVIDTDGNWILVWEKP